MRRSGYGGSTEAISDGRCLIECTMSDKYRIVLAEEDFSPEECVFIRQLAGYDENCPSPGAELRRCLNDYLVFQNDYICAAKRIRTELEILELDYRIRYDHRIIRAIDGRTKSVKSICTKLQEKQKPLTLASASENLTDIAGIRVICPYISDIYEIENRLLAQDSISLIRRSDYICHPKPSGYRSLHLIVGTTLHSAGKTSRIPVEIQLRTVAMDSWAGLEHKLKYKNPLGVSDDVSTELSECAAVIAQTDERMQRIYNSLFGKEK